MAYIAGRIDAIYLLILQHIGKLKADAFKYVIRVR